MKVWAIVMMTCAVVAFGQGKVTKQKSKELTWSFKLKSDKPPAARADFWVSTDEGRTWSLCSERGISADCSITQDGYAVNAVIRVQADGTYGFYGQLGSPRTNSAPAPSAGEKPQKTFVVDGSAPLVTSVIPSAVSADTGKPVAFEINYSDLTSVNTTAIEVYVSEDGSKSYRAALPADAVFSYQAAQGKIVASAMISNPKMTSMFFVLTDELGNKMLPPAAGTVPHLVIAGKGQVVPSTGAENIVINPRKGDILEGGNPLVVKWMVEGASNYMKDSVMLHFSVGETPLVLIADRQPFTGFYVWFVPDVGTDDLRIKISARNNLGEPVEVAEVRGVKVRAEVKPNLAEARKHYMNARMLVARANKRDAMVEYMMALEKWPKYPQALNDMGTIYYELGEVTKSLEFYLRGKMAEPSNAMFYANCALAYYKLGLYDDAVRNLDDALNLEIMDETTANAAAERYFMCAQAFASMKMFEKAKACLEKMKGIKNVYPRLMETAAEFSKSLPK